MKTEDFELFSSHVKTRSGLVLTPDKAYLLESRLMPVARKLGLKDLEELAKTIREKRDEKILEAVTEAMTTNETFFFRDQKPFDQFKNIVIPHLLKVRAAKKHVRIWSAASSTGQEAYSLAMILTEEAAKFAGWKFDIIGTDLSVEVVEKAKQGVYTQFEVQRGLPIQLLMKYFTQDGDKWKISQKIKDMVQYKTMNLLTEWVGLGQFDIVFIRNVLIYFDAPTKTKILERVSQLMPPDGVMFMGGAETVLGISDKFRGMDEQRGVYVPASCPVDLWKKKAA